MSGLLESGIQLMIVGMGTVFFFLTVLVFATLAMSAVVKRFLPEVQTSLQTTLQPIIRTPKSLVDEEVAAIAVAVHAHRNQSRKKN
jgi:oxaloacetate decarboxylase gamma subunit